MPFKTHRRANSSGTHLSPVPERSSRCLSLFPHPAAAACCSAALLSNLFNLAGEPAKGMGLYLLHLSGASGQAPPDWGSWEHDLHPHSGLGEPAGVRVCTSQVRLKSFLMPGSVPPSSDWSLSESKKCIIDAAGKACSFLSIGTAGGGLCLILVHIPSLSLSIPISNGVNLPSGL